MNAIHELWRCGDLATDAYETLLNAVFAVINDVGPDQRAVLIQGVTESVLMLELAITP